MARYGRLIGALVLLGMTGFAGIGVGIAAEACSARYIKMIVANPPGGVGDLIARTVAEGASTELKQSVVVENRSGAVHGSEGMTKTGVLRAGINV